MYPDSTAPHVSSFRRDPLPLNRPCQLASLLAQPAAYRLSGATDSRLGGHANCGHSLHNLETIQSRRELTAAEPPMPPRVAPCTTRRVSIEERDA